MHKLFTLTTSLLFGLSSPILPWISSCSHTNEGVPVINSVDKKTSTFFSVDLEADQPKWKKEEIYAPVYFFNGSGAPYLSISAYVSAFMQFKSQSFPQGHTYSVENHNAETIITNIQNGAWCKVDFISQTISFNDYDSFLNYRYDSTNPLSSGCAGGESLFIEKVDEYVVNPNTYVINLKKYNLVAYWHNNNGYLPYDLYRNIINDYPGDCWFFYNSNFYQIIGGTGTKTSEKVINLYKSIKTTQSFSSSYMEYCYNVLALTLDTKYGLPNRQSRLNPGTEIQYFPNGAYEVLEPYHEDLTSIVPNVANQALQRFILDNCDDGGHSFYYGVDFLSTFALEKTFGKETLGTFGFQESLSDARYESVYFRNEIFPDGFPSIEIFDPLQPKPTKIIFQHKVDILDCDRDGKWDTVWLTFGEFDSLWYDYEYKNLYNLVYDDYAEPYDVNKIPYYYDTILTTMYLQKIFSSQDPTFANIKNLFVDLSLNGGGVVFTEHFLSSYLCGAHNKCQPQSQKYNGGVTHTIYNPHTKSIGKYTVYADVNQDGQYDNNDYLPEDVNLYCITSPASFSCGNMLPNDLATCSNCKFLGATSGGGACFVDNYIHFGLGNMFQISSNFHMLKNNSTVDNFISVDSGVDPNIPYQLSQPSNFFNRSKIWQDVHNS